MLLTKAQLEKITKGCLYIGENADGRLAPRRFTEKQEAVYSATGFFPKCRVPSGVRFDFYSDTEFINLVFKYGEHLGRNFMSIDLYDDGVMVASKYSEAYQLIDEDSFTYKFPDKKRRRVTVYLPFSVELLFSKIELSDGAEIEPYDNFSKKLLAFGDSITQGYDALRNSDNYVTLLCRHFGWDWINQGAGGYTCVADSLDPSLPYKPDIVTVAYGTNDWSKAKTMEEYDRTTSDYLARLHEIYSDIPVMILLPIWRRDNGAKKPAGPFYEARARYGAEAAKYPNFRVLETIKYVPHVPFYFNDLTLHPNDLGFAEYARNLAVDLEEYR